MVVAVILLCRDFVDMILTVNLYINSKTTFLLNFLFNTERVSFFEEMQSTLMIGANIISAVHYFLCLQRHISAHVQTYFANSLLTKR